MNLSFYWYPSCQNSQTQCVYSIEQKALTGLYYLTFAASEHRQASCSYTCMIGKLVDLAVSPGKPELPGNDSNESGKR